MKKVLLLTIVLSSLTNLSDARNLYRKNYNNPVTEFDCQAECGCANGCLICNNAPYCGPYPRLLPDDYDSYSDNTRMDFLAVGPCAPRNDSKNKGYLYKGMWWDVKGVRYWAFRNNTSNTITIEALGGGELKSIPSGDVTNINRGESYSFRIQAPARRFELFNSDSHAIEIFINLKGDIDYRPEAQALAQKPDLQRQKEIFKPKF